MSNTTPTARCDGCGRFMTWPPAGWEERWVETINGAYVEGDFYYCARCVNPKGLAHV